MAIRHPKRHISSHLAYNRQHATQQGGYPRESTLSESGLSGSQAGVLECKANIGGQRKQSIGTPALRCENASSRASHHHT